MQSKTIDPRRIAMQLLCWTLGLALFWAAGQAAAQSFTSPAVSSMTVPLSGRADTKGEPVTINGTARIKTTAVPDLDWRATPVVIVTIEFLSMTAVGATSGGRYTVEETIQKLRTLAPSDTVDVTFPITRAGTPDLTTRMIGLATFALSFDTNTGKLTGATGTLGTSPY